MVVIFVASVKGVPILDETGFCYRISQVRVLTFFLMHAYDRESNNQILYVTILFMAALSIAPFDDRINIV